MICVLCVICDDTAAATRHCVTKRYSLIHFGRWISLWVYIFHLNSHTNENMFLFRFVISVGIFVFYLSVLMFRFFFFLILFLLLWIWFRFWGNNTFGSSSFDLQLVLWFEFNEIFIWILIAPKKAQTAFLAMWPIDHG